MPIRHTDKGWFWGSKGPFDSKAKALAVARAAHSSGFKEQEMNTNKTSEFITFILNTATVAHLMHFKTDSYAEHMALGQYYESVVDLVDGLAESIQGKYERLPIYSGSFNCPDMIPIEYMKRVQEYIEVARTEMLPADSEIQNEVDNIANLVNTTIDRLGRK